MDSREDQAKKKWEAVDKLQCIQEMQDENFWRQRLSGKSTEADKEKHKCSSYSSFYGHLWMQNVVLEKNPSSEQNYVLFFFF